MICASILIVRQMSGCCQGVAHKPNTAQLLRPHLVRPLVLPHLEAKMCRDQSPPGSKPFQMTVPLIACRNGWNAII